LSQLRLKPLTRRIEKYSDWALNLHDILGGDLHSNCQLYPLHIIITRPHAFDQTEAFNNVDFQHGLQPGTISMVKMILLKYSASRNDSVRSKTAHQDSDGHQGHCRSRRTRSYRCFPLEVRSATTVYSRRSTSSTTQSTVFNPFLFPGRSQVPRKNHYAYIFHNSVKHQLPWRDDDIFGASCSDFLFQGPRIVLLATHIESI
jgi:hypothetical protein